MPKFAWLPGLHAGLAHVAMGMGKAFVDVATLCLLSDDRALGGDELQETEGVAALELAVRERVQQGVPAQLQASMRGRRQSVSSPNPRGSGDDRSE